MLPPASRVQLRSGVFQTKDAIAADPFNIVMEAKALADTRFALVVLRSLCGEPPVAVLATDHTIDLVDASWFPSWFEPIGGPCPLTLPDDLQKQLACPSVVAVPIQSPVWQLGVLAFPLQPGWKALGEQLASFAASTSLTLELVDRRVQRQLLEMVDQGLDQSSLFPVCEMEGPLVGALKSWRVAPARVA